MYYHIGTIDLEAIMEYQDHEKVNSKKKIEEYLGLNNKDRYVVEQKLYEENKIKIAKTSARFDGERVKHKK